MHIAYQLAVVFLMLVLNGFFAAYEMALASISRARISVLMTRKVKGADEAAFMKDRMEASLAVVQVGISLVGAVAAATGGLGAANSLSPYLQKTFGISGILGDVLALIFLVIPLSAITIVFAELIPKMVALNNRERICLMMSPTMKGLSQFAYPVITVLERIVKWSVALGARSHYFAPKTEEQPGLHELHAAATLARASRLIGAREEKIVLSAAQLSVRPVKDIMLPLADISMVSLNSSLSEALVRAHMDMHTRFPVCSQEGDLQSVTGYINFKDIVAALKLNQADPSIKGIVRPIRTVHGNTPISQVLEAMMQERLHIVMVGVPGGLVGMVTMEDIIEELVGEIEDEFDRLPSYIHPYGGGWIMGGGVPLSVVAQTTGAVLAAPEPAMKLADWCARRLGGVLKGGEIFEADGLQVTVRKLRRKKVGEAIVALLPK